MPSTTYALTPASVAARIFSLSPEFPFQCMELLEASDRGVNDRADALAGHAVDHVRAHAGQRGGADFFAVAVVGKHDDGTRVVARDHAQIFKRVAIGGVGIDDHDVRFQRGHLAMQVESGRHIGDDFVACARQRLL